MKYFIIILLSIIYLSSCRTEQYRYVCTVQQQQRAIEFVQNSIKNSNNMSDEEMEDVISQLERTSIHLNCKNRLLSGVQGDDYFTPDPISDSLIITNY